MRTTSVSSQCPRIPQPLIAQMQERIAEVKEELKDLENQIHSLEEAENK